MDVMNSFLRGSLNLSFNFFDLLYQGRFDVGEFPAR